MHRFSTWQTVLLHQLYVQPSSSDLTTCTYCQIPQVKGSVAEDCSHFRCQLRVPGCYHISDQLSISPNCHNQLLGFSSLLEWIIELRQALNYVWMSELCLIHCKPMDYSQPGSSVHGILYARILEWVAIPFSRGSSQPRDQTSRIEGRFFTTWVTYQYIIKGLPTWH